MPRLALLHLTFVALSLSGCSFLPTNPYSPERLSAFGVGVEDFAPATDAGDVELVGSARAGLDVSVIREDGQQTAAERSGESWRVRVPLTEGYNGLTVWVCSREAECAALRTPGIWRVVFRLIAHRGASSLAPENTLSAFRAAYAHNVRDVELDVHLSRDGRAVVIHDATTARTSGVDLVVRDTDSSILRTLDVGSFKGAEFAGERIPFLEDVLAELPDDARAWVELKSGTDCAAEVARRIRASGKTRQVTVHSFNLEALVRFKALAPDVSIWFNKIDAPSEEELTHLQLQHVEGLNLYVESLTDAFVRTVREQRMGLATFTVDDPARAATLTRLGLDGMVTDRLDVLAPTTP